MIWLRDRFFNEDNDEIFIIELFTSCCKGRLPFKKIGNETYFDLTKMEACPPGWNKLIEDAIVNDVDICKKIKNI